MTGARPRRLVVTVGTDTEIGKTWVSARLIGHWLRLGLTVAARKPAQSFTPGQEPTDAEVLAAASGEDRDTVCPPERSYPVAMAPPMAAQALNRPAVMVGGLVSELAWPPRSVDVGLVETAGGLRSPQADDGDAVDLVCSLGADTTLLVANAGLGTINSVRLCASALAHRSLPFVVVLNRFDLGDDLHRANLEWLTERDGIDVVAGTEDRLSELAERLVL